MKLILKKIRNVVIDYKQEFIPENIAGENENCEFKENCQKCKDNLGKVE